MKEKIIGKITTAVLVIVIMCNAFMMVRIWLTMRADSFYREKKAEYVLPDGFTPQKIKIAWDESLSPPSGWVVRYAGRGCIYCKLDFEWERLATRLEQLNYRTILLLPNDADKFDEDGIIPWNAQQMAYVSMDWVKQFRFSGTPTVVIFNDSGRVLWHGKGMLSEADYISAEKAVVKNAKI